MKSVVALLLPLFLLLATPVTPLWAAVNGDLPQPMAMKSDATLGRTTVAPALPAAALQQATSQETRHSSTGTNGEWQAVPLPAGITLAQIRDFTVHPQDAAILYLATEHGLFRSHDAGNTWSRFENLGDILIFSVAQSEDNPQQLYVHSFQSYRSEDGGASWQAVSPPEQACGFVVAPSASNRIYARDCAQGDLPPVIRSDDGGRNWIVPDNGMTETFDNLAVLPNQPDTLIATNFDQTWRSTDGGNSWTQVAIGVRYFGKPVFDRQSPPTAYLGHWTGLLRSRDGGATWEDSTASREFSALVPLAAENGVIVGGNTTELWRFEIDGNGWQATDWQAPAGVEVLRGSAHGGDILYARNGEGLWRLDTRPVPDFAPVDFIYLPLVQNAAPTTANSAADAATVVPNSASVSAATATAVGSTAQVAVTQAAEQAIAQANLYRAQVGVSPLEVHPAIVTAAQNHADYRRLNFADESAWAYGAHGEVEGKPGFTGKWPSDRIAAAGFPWDGGAEVIHGLGDPVTSVDGWIATVYHRFPILDPYHDYVGYGYHSGTPVAVDVMDFGTGPTTNGRWIAAAPHPLAYPADGQTNVPTSWNGAEIPNPLPPGVTGPVGYPFTLQPVGGKLTVTRAELRTADGTVVATHPNPADCAAGSCLALMAVSPLAPNTTYVVTAAGDVEGVPFDREWRFTTGAGQETVTATAMPTGANPVK